MYMSYRGHIDAGMCDEGGCRRWNASRVEFRRGTLPQKSRCDSGNGQSRRAAVLSILYFVRRPPKYMCPRRHVPPVNSALTYEDVLSPSPAIMRAPCMSPTFGCSLT